MSYLKFDKKLMINLEQSLPKEMLRTNQAGAYHCTTVVGCNTRKQHGLLVIPIPEMDNDSHVLLSTLDETVIQHGAPFNLGLHKYAGNTFSPNGHKYIREYDCESVPKVTYRVGGVILTKEKIFISHDNRILIKYTLEEAHSATTLQFRPFLAFRNANDLCMANGVADQSYQECINGASFCLYKGYPRLYLQFNRKPKFVFNPTWYKDIEYPKDEERNIPYREDLFVPGYFEIPIKKGESIYFSAGLEERSTRNFAKLYEGEVQSRTPRTSFYNCLKNAAKQFYYENKDGFYLMAGYPWFKVRARDMFTALPGTTLHVHHPVEYDKIMATGIEALDRFMATGKPDKNIELIELPDVPLWAIWAIQAFAKENGIEACREKYGRFVADVLDYITAQRHPLLWLDDNGLVRTDGTRRPVSWMDSSNPDGTPIIPRTGYLVEFNALWYNALRFAASLYADDKEMAAKVAEWTDIADRCGTSFIDTFLNDYGYLYDYVDGAYTDLSVRPNMIIAAGLEYTPLDRRQRKTVLDVVTRELLTPKGLRTLSPKSFGYRPTYHGTPEERELAYFNGTVRPWLISFYTDAYIRVFGIGRIPFIERMMIGYEDEMTQGCIGSLSELYDGNPPFYGRGAISFASSVAGVLTVLRLFKNLHIIDK